MPTIEERVEPDSSVSAGMFRAYAALDVSDFPHHGIGRSKFFAKPVSRFNGRENFWNQAKRYLRKFNGIKPGHFSWFSTCANGASVIMELSTWLHSWAKEAKH